MRLFYFLSVALVCPLFLWGQWQPISQDFDGDDMDLRKGHSVAVSADGSIVAIRAPYDANNSEKQLISYTEVYRYASENTWEMIGERINVTDEFPRQFEYIGARGSVDLSDDGKILAIGEPYFKTVIEDELSNAVGRVRIFENIDDEWVPIGEPIYGLPDFQEGASTFGEAIALSSDGQIIAIGGLSVKNDLGEYNGKVMIFQNVNGQWQQMGNSLYGYSDSQNFGISVTISADGQKLGVGVPFYGNPVQQKVYRFESGQWVEDGSFDTGGGYNSISLSADGNIVALADRYSFNGTSYNGKVSVYKKESDSWELYGNAIEGIPSTSFASSVEISRDGNLLYVGSAVSSGQGKVGVYQYVSGSWELQDEILANIEDGANSGADSQFGYDTSASSDGSVLIVGSPSSSWYTEGRTRAGSARVYNNCELSDISISAEQTGTNCSGSTTTITASILPEYYAVNGIVNWYASSDATEPIFTGTEYETPELTETTSFWVEAVTLVGCSSERVEVVVEVFPVPTLIVPTTEITACAGDVVLTADVEEGNLAVWYDSEEATEWIGTGEEFTVEDLEEGIYSYWVQAYNPATHCVSGKTEVTVTVLALPELDAEISYEICFGNEAYLYAYSDGNVIFWYASETDEDYLYHGNNFIIEGLEVGTHTYWVEAYNVSTGCTSQRTEVTVTVNPTPEAPIAIGILTAVPGQTLADLEENIEAEGELTWYADEYLTIELPNTTEVEDNSVYYVTQTVNGCESEAKIIEVELLEISDVNNSALAYYPNPVKDKLNFTGKEKVQSVQIFDASGRLLINQSQSNGIFQLDVTTIPKGSYVVKAQTDKGIKTFKIIKN